MKHSSNIQYFDNNLRETKGYKFDRRERIFWLLCELIMFVFIVYIVDFYVHLDSKNLLVPRYLVDALVGAILFNITIGILGAEILTLKCEKIGFGEDGVYIFHRWNRHFNKPLFIAYSEILHLYYSYPYDRFMFSHRSRFVSESVFVSEITRENMKRLRKRLEVLKEKGEWNGDLKIYTFVDETGKYIGPVPKVYTMDDEKNEKKDEG